VQQLVPGLRAERRLDVVIANAENASGGSGCLPAAYRQLREAGVDLVTLGDHIYKKADIIPVLERDERVCKPANFPPEAPGREFALAAARDGTPVAAFCVLGRTFMRAVDCPFRAADRVLQAVGDRARCVIVDAHAEATADKYLLAHHLQGRVSAVLGTHTHVQTADEQIFRGGTAFLCDAGFTGPHDSVIGREIEPIIKRFMTNMPQKFEVAKGRVLLQGAVVEIDERGGKAIRIERISEPLNEQNPVKLRPLTSHTHT